MVDGARSVLNDLLADVYIFTDHMTGLEAGQSPGYGMMLVAETTTGCFISAECTASTASKVSDTSCMASTASRVMTRSQHSQQCLCKQMTHGVYSLTW